MCVFIYANLQESGVPIGVLGSVGVLYIRETFNKKDHP